MEARPLPLTAPMLAVLKYAALAPSSHNSQPWKFRLGGNELALFADRTRALPVVDPRDRELVMSCGAALFLARVALRYFGAQDLVELFPEPGDRDFLARLRAGDPRDASAEDRALFDAIPRRRTYRLPFEPPPVPEPLVAALQASAGEEGAWLRVLDGEPVREAAASLVMQGDRLQMADAAFRRELAAWTRTNYSRAGDGIPGHALGLGDLASAAGPLVLRTFDLGKGQAAKDRDLALGSPVLAVLGTFADSPYDWLAAGQALARVLLQARAQGVFASFLNQAVEVPQLRAQLQVITGLRGFPQVLLRLGYGREGRHGRATPRRPLEDLLV